ncbi:MAG: cyclic nucleotide-binding domain-containing protein [Actinobacteria bacterium]|nr:cyclic nucleotide-binding domain-containing protein [Actinomycetota bacterium]
MRDSARVLRDVLRNPELRRLELAWVGSVLGHWSYVVALAVYAYREGGAAAVGVVGVIRMFSGALGAPLMSTLGDRFRRERVMLSADLVRAGLMGGAAALIAADGPAAAVYAIAAAATVVGTSFRPAQAALLPSLARTPAELTAANAASSTVESIGSFAGPALGGLVLAVSGIEAVFLVNAASFVWSALLVSRIRSGASGAPRERAKRPSFVRGLGEGGRALAGEPDARVLVALYCAQTLVAGALNVLIVVSALELLERGTAWVGFLNSMVGIGGLAGSLVALGLVSRLRLAGDFATGLALFGGPLVLLAVWPEPAAALVLLVAVGVGNTLVDVSAVTLLQRAAPEEALARVFGLLESLLLAAIGLGALIAPGLVSALGARWALVACGALLPVLALLSWRRLARIDARARVPGERLALLRGIPIFAPLPESVLERLASQLAEVRAPAGGAVVSAGEPGDLFYAIASGEVAVEGRRLGPGEFFGEIALLKDVPRTATVTAATDVALLTLEREEFIAAVTGHAESAAAADAIVAQRLAPLRAGVASV